MKEKTQEFATNYLSRLEFWKGMNKMILSLTISEENPECGEYYEKKDRIIFQKDPQSSTIFKGYEQNIPTFDDFMLKSEVQEILWRRKSNGFPEISSVVQNFEREWKKYS